MSYGSILPLGSIAAIRPVYLIVMGIFLMVVAWRLSKNSSGWAARFIVAGALLLGFGYTVMIPLYEAGVIEPVTRKGIYHGSAATAMGWHAVKLVIMNSGWLLFGMGLALHANLFTTPTPKPRPKTALPPAATHEFIT